VSDVTASSIGTTRAWPAMVMTAGLGTRLRPLSRLRAKPAFPVAGVPLAGRILRWLAAAGVRDAVLNLHHKPTTLTAALGDGAAFGLRVRYSWEPRILGSAGGPARALPLLDATRFFLVNGDTLSDVDLAALARQHVARGARVTMALVRNPDPTHYGGVIVAPDGAIIGFSRRGPTNQGCHFIGVQVVDADVFAALDPNQPADSVGGCYADVLASQPGALQGFLCEAAFHDIGTTGDYLATSLAFASAEHQPGSLIGSGCAIAPGATVSDSVLWDSVTVDEGSAIQACVVADRVHIPSGLRCERQVIVRAADRVCQDDTSVVGDLALTPIDSRPCQGIPQCHAGP
jgi:NDP-sugar pyrophosphorylase family protein